MKLLSVLKPWRFVTIILVVMYATLAFDFHNPTRESGPVGTTFMSSFDDILYRAL